MYHMGSPVGTAPQQVVQLAEDLKLALELQPNQEERESLRAQLPSETTQALINWLQNGEVSIQTPLIYRISVCILLCSSHLPSHLLEWPPFIHFLLSPFVCGDFGSSQKELHQNSGRSFLHERFPPARYSL